MLELRVDALIKDDIEFYWREHDGHVELMHIIEIAKTI